MFLFVFFKLLFPCSLWSGFQHCVHYHIDTLIRLYYIVPLFEGTLDNNAQNQFSYISKKGFLHV